MNSSQEINEIYSSIINFQSEMQQPKKNATNPHFKNKYSSLDEIVSTIKPTLTKYALAFLQDVKSDGTNIQITTRIIHTSGQWIESDVLTMHADKQTAQGQGSAITYGRRYQLSAMLGITSDEDDDGNIASANDDRRELSDAQINRLYAIAKSKNVSVDDIKKAILKKYNKTSTKDLTKKEYDDICKNLENKGD